MGGGLLKAILEALLSFVQGFFNKQKSDDAMRELGRNDVRNEINKETIDVLEKMQKNDLVIPDVDQFARDLASGKIKL